MATIDNPLRTQFYVQTNEKGLRLLPFELITIHDDLQFYELVTERLDEKFNPRAGTLTPPVILDKNQPLPIGDGVFEYHGI